MICVTCCFNCNYIVNICVTESHFSTCNTKLYYSVSIVVTCNNLFTVTDNNCCITGVDSYQVKFNCSLICDSCFKCSFAFVNLLVNSNDTFVKNCNCYFYCKSVSVNCKFTCSCFVNSCLVVTCECVVGNYCTCNTFNCSCTNNFFAKHIVDCNNFNLSKFNCFCGTTGNKCKSLVSSYHILCTIFCCYSCVSYNINSITNSTCLCFCLNYFTVVCVVDNHINDFFCCFHFVDSPVTVVKVYTTPSTVGNHDVCSISGSINENFNLVVAGFSCLICTSNLCTNDVGFAFVRPRVETTICIINMAVHCKTCE